jgi:hypothetical protein
MTPSEQFDVWAAKIEKQLADHEGRIKALEGDAPDPQPPGEFTPPELNEIVWDDPDVSGWAVASTIDAARAEWRSGSQQFPHSKAGQWPTQVVQTPVEGNPWIILKYQPDQRWHAQTWEWLGVGQTSKGLAANQFKSHLAHPGKVPAWSGPTKGEWYGWLVSACARHGRFTSARERSEILWRQWP